MKTVKNDHSDEFRLIMSSPFRQFMIISIIGTVLTLSSLIYTHIELSREYLRVHLNTHNQNLSVVLRNSLLTQGLEDALNEGNKALSEEMLSTVRSTLKRELGWVPVIKIKVYSRDYGVLFSSMEDEIGDSAIDNDGVKSALRGFPVSSRVPPNHFNEFDNVIELKDIHQQYIPIRSRQTNEVIGVFETYLNVYELVRDVRIKQRAVFWMIGIILVLFFIALAYTFLKTNRLLISESRRRQANLDELNEIHADLEHRVEARTAELDGAKSFLQSVIDGISNPLLVIRPDFTIALMNRPARDQIPPGEGEHNHRYCYQMSHGLNSPCSEPDHPCSFADVMQQGRPARVRHTHYDADGKPVVVDLLTTPLYSADGEFEGVIEVEQDVTEMVQMQAGLVKSEARLQATMDNVPDAILTCDSGYVIQSTNRSACHLFNCEEADLVGKKFGDMVLDNIGIDVLQFENTNYQQTALKRIDGSEFPVDLWIGPLQQGNAIISYIIVVRDISSRIQSQFELDASRQQYFHQDKMVAIGQLAAGILHEVGNPIAAIAGATAEFMEGYVPRGKDDNVRKNIDLINEQITRLGKITREIADFASPRPRERELLDLNGLLRSTSQLLTYDQRFSSIGIEMKLDRNLPAIVGVADQLTQVFMNLLINAMDACSGRNADEGGVILTSETDGDQVHVCVQDLGIGMSEETLEHVMELFYTTKPVGKGSGLGLSLCDTIVRAHGGSLKIESEEGQGTQVHVSLPIDRDKS